MDQNSQDLGDVKDSKTGSTPIQVIDAFIRLVQVDHEDQNTLWDRARRELLTFACGTDVAQVDDDMLKRALERQDVKQQRQVAASILRLLPQPSMQPLQERTLRPHVMALLDMHLPDAVCRSLRVDRNAQTHVKLDQLARKIAEHEATFHSALQFLTSLDRVAAQRSKVMRALNEDASKMYIRPFLPELVEAHVGELFTRVVRYVDSRESSDVLQPYTAAVEACDHFVSLYDGHCTLYADWLADHLGRQLKHLVATDYQTTTGAQPAELIATFQSRKYPLHLVDNDFHLVFEIRNGGAGYANDVEVSLEQLVNFSLLDDRPVRISRIAPKETLSLRFTARVAKPIAHIEGLAMVIWNDCEVTDQQKSVDTYFSAEAQRSDINWASLVNPYSLEPVDNERDLLGRSDVTRPLISAIGERAVGSAAIKGQKRVGKTSIAKAIGSHFATRGAIIIDLNHYNASDASETINNLGRLICRKLRRHATGGETPDRLPRFHDLEIPVFNGALSPLGILLEEATDQLEADERIILILDEFDQLPLDLFIPGSTSQAFFLALRSISSIPKVGIMLVGGERMDFILYEHGMQLNKFHIASVDYFDRDLAYEALVQEPARGTLEFTKDALLSLHHVTAGNPYFTKEVCRRIFEAAVHRRDCYVTPIDVDEAIDEAVRRMDAAVFSHFWKDAIFTVDREREEEITSRRQRILIALSDVAREGSPAVYSHIAAHIPASNLKWLERDLEEFLSRKVFTVQQAATESGRNLLYNFKMPLFARRLEARGVQEVIKTFPELDDALEKRQQEEELKVKIQEIKDLIDKWGRNYKHREITTHKVQEWLDQFGSPAAQRAMFHVLRATRFYRYAYIQDKLMEVDRSIVRRGLLNRREGGKLKHSDVLVSYLDGPGKSGAEMANLYADANAIYVQNVVEQGKLKASLEEKTHIRALVFVDDFVGTGRSAARYLRSMDEIIGGVVRQRRIKVVFVAVVAFKDGWATVEQVADRLMMPIETRACEILDVADCLFSDVSTAFKDEQEKRLAREITLENGKALTRSMASSITPLGFGDYGLSVVFENSCPNNTVPVLWVESAEPAWTPLFAR